MAAQPFEPASAIFPGHVAPVVRQSADGEHEIALMSWGFVFLQNSRAPRRVTNVRDDKILERRLPGVRHRELAEVGVLRS
jgi:putative SOS response-associated peptidase YedK